MIDKKINFKPVYEATGIDVSFENLLYVQPPCSRIFRPAGKAAKCWDISCGNVPPLSIDLCTIKFVGIRNV